MSEEKTVSICIPADIICKQNKNLEQLTIAAYEIARSASLFKIKEIILLSKDKESKEILIFGSILQFFITPRYLVNETFFKLFKDKLIPKNIFNKAKKLPILPNLIEFLEPYKINKEIRFKEGISINKNINKKRRKNLNGKVIKINKNDKTTKFVQIGTDKLIKIKNDKGLPFNVRVSIDLKEEKVVSFKEAWGSKYCGYNIRICSNLIEIFTEVNTKLISKDGYDMSLIVKTSNFFNKDKNLDINKKLNEVNKQDLKDKRHLLVFVIGNERLDLKLNDKEGEGEDEEEEDEYEIFDGLIRVPTGSRIEEGVIVALSSVCQW